MVVLYLLNRGSTVLDLPFDLVFLIFCWVSKLELKVVEILQTKMNYLLKNTKDESLTYRFPSLFGQFFDLFLGI